jgi:hypothetical protein
MSETPLAPTPVRDVLLGFGEVLGGRGKLGFLAAAAVLLGGVVAIVYFAVFPIPRPAGPAGQARPRPALDQSAVGAANTFTKLAWNDHNCRAASRYSRGLKNCASRLLPSGTHVTVNTWLIRQHCCIQYIASNGETISYSMAKTPRGWRVVAVTARRPSP